jgi:hypothetical protein
MPSLRDSLIEFDPKRYGRVPIQQPRLFNPAMPPELPIAIRRSPVMISSLPPISTSVDGVLRQFYGGRNVPTRRLVTP